MGKIRAKTIGSEEEQKQKEEAKKRREAKKVTKDTSGSPSVPSIPKKEKATTNKEESEPKKKIVKKKSAKKIRSPRWTANLKLRDKNKQYSVKEALDILIAMKKAKFDESVELHVNTTEKGVSGIFNPPHGTGKQTKVAIISPAADGAEADKLLKEIEAGKINFDVLLATPDAMSRLAKVAKILGPRGLMPNPKNGTISANPQTLAKKFEAGQINFKTEAKFPIVHISVGKMSFGKEKLAENINVFLKSMDKAKTKNAYIKSTMSPSIRINL